MSTVFVTSATGSTGSALCRELLLKGWHVRATTRDLSTQSAQALQALGVDFTLGNWDDEESLRSGLHGCDKLFLCLLPNLQDFDQMPSRAQRIVKIAKAEGVRQAVSLTTLGTFMLEKGTEPAIAPGPFFAKHLESKYRAEQALINGGFEHWTILRPAFFMANFLEPKIQFGYSEVKDKGTWTSSMTAETPLGLVDHVDIAQFASNAFQNPEKYHGHKLGIASEELTPQIALDQLADAIGDGRSLKALFMTDEECVKAQDSGSWLFFSSERCCRDMSKCLDLEHLRTLVPRLTSFSEFLRREKDNVDKTYCAA